MTTLIFGADHAGFDLKEHLMTWVKTKGYAVTDIGTFSKESMDYPDIVPAMVDQVRKGGVGVLLCGSGIGMSMAANRFSGIRAALCQDALMARLSRQHNNSNILVLGARLIGIGRAEDCLTTFLNTNFEGGRHQCRLDKIDGFSTE